MSPKARLTLSITALSGVVAAVLLALSLFWLAEARLREVSETARISAESVKTYLLQQVQQKAQLPPGASMEEAKAAWRAAARGDAQIEGFLLSAVAASPSLVEILVVDDKGVVLVSSIPEHEGTRVAEAPDLDEWTTLPSWERMRQVLGPARDLEIHRTLAAGGQPIFTIRVLVSTALVRGAVLPQLRRLALAGLISLAVAALLAALLANFAGRPLERVSRFIDAINEGRTTTELPPPDRELAAIESKLLLLGERVRDASQRGSVEQLLERLQDAVLLFDSGEKLVMASRATERFLSGPRWDLIGRPLEDVFRSDDPLGSFVQSSINLRRTFYNQAFEWQSPDGSPLPLSVSIEALTDFPERHFLGAVVTLRDAASRRQLESQIDSSYRREAFGRLLQGVAHEIKNPLNSIYTHVQLLQMELGDQIPSAAMTMETIGREIKTLDRMVVTLLDFTRPLQLELAETDLAELAREIAGLLRPQAGAKSIEIVVDEQSAGTVVRADRSLLRQAILNIATNAVECMQRPGTIRLVIASEADAVTLAVADEGPGIPEEIHDKVFRLYFTTKGKRGSGIGLAMAYRTMEMHGANLDFTTTPEGTTFRFRFQAV